MAANRNIDIYKGDTYVHELRLKDSSNVAINISTRTYTGQIRKKKKLRHCFIRICNINY